PAIGRASQAPHPKYNAENFIYNQKTDTYTCPEGHKLTSNQSHYKTRNYTFKQYKTKACKGCSVRSLCTKAKNGKIVQRSEYAPYIEANAHRVTQNKQRYKQRQALVE
ncbi:transposase, partial [Aequorivita sinensis]